MGKCLTFRVISRASSASVAAAMVKSTRSRPLSGKLDAPCRNAYSTGMKAIVSEKGQVTIPKAVRSRLGIRPGTVIEFEADRGRLIGRKAGASDVIDQLYGSLKMDESVDTYLERIRGR
jgi:looped-hinge helix DNA binding domain, AbrB family